MIFNSAAAGFPMSIDYSFGGSNKPDKTVKDCIQLIREGFQPFNNNSIYNIAFLKLCKDIKRTSIKLNIFKEYNF